MKSIVLVIDIDGHVRPFADIERDVFLVAFERYGGNVSEITRRFGVSRATYYRRRKELFP